MGKYRETRDRPLLEAYHIGAMLQLAEAVNLAGIPSLYLPVENGLPISAAHLRAGVDFILSQKHLQRRVLVACGAGMSRASAFTVAALKEAENLGLLDALSEVKSCHANTLIHPVLWESLGNFYHESDPARRP